MNNNQIMGRDIIPTSLYNLVERYKFATSKLHNDLNLTEEQKKLLKRKEEEHKTAIAEMLLKNIDDKKLKDIY